MKTMSLKNILAALFLSVALVSCSSSDDSSQSSQNDSGSALERIRSRDTLLVGSSGDYRPLSYLDPETNKYWGFDVDLVEIIAKSIGVKVKYVPTSWPTLTDDMMNPSLFDMAMCGITVTEARKEIMLMSEGYLKNGKTILCRKEDAGRFLSVEDMNKKDVRIMVNPGGLNEKFARENLQDAEIIVHERNEEIPALIAEGKADIMITEIVEAPYYVQNDERLAAPLLDKPFNSGKIGALMRKGDEDLLELVNSVIDSCKKNGTLKQLHEKYGFNYDF